MRQSNHWTVQKSDFLVPSMLIGAERNMELDAHSFFGGF
jgi:hypothetical protein